MQIRGISFPSILYSSAATHIVREIFKSGSLGVLFGVSLANGVCVGCSLKLFKFVKEGMDGGGEGRGGGGGGSWSGMSKSSNNSGNGQNKTICIINTLNKSTAAAKYHQD